MRSSNHGWAWAAEGKALFTPRSSLNAFSGPRQDRTFELVEASEIGSQFLQASSNAGIQ